MIVGNFKFGDIVFFRPNDVYSKKQLKLMGADISTCSGKAYAVCGIYYKTDSSGNIILIDTYSWSGKIFDEGVTAIPKDRLTFLSYPGRGLRKRYCGIRADNHDRLLYSRDSRFEGMTAEEELKIREAEIT